MSNLTVQQTIRDQIDALYEQAGITDKEKAKELALMTAVEVAKNGTNGASITINGSIVITILIEEI